MWPPVSICPCFAVGREGRRLTGPCLEHGHFLWHHLCVALRVRVEDFFVRGVQRTGPNLNCSTASPPLLVFLRSTPTPLIRPGSPADPGPSPGGSPAWAPGNSLRPGASHIAARATFGDLWGYQTWPVPALALSHPSGTVGDVRAPPRWDTRCPPPQPSQLCAAAGQPYVSFPDFPFPSLKVAVMPGRRPEEKGFACVA